MKHDRVPSWGRRDARLVLIGEAPGRWEHERGEPFVGPSGKLLEEWWGAVGLGRNDFYITNVLDYQPKAIDAVPRDEMEAAIIALHERLAALDDPWLIVPTGNYSLYALLGKGRVSWHQRDGHHLRPGVTSHRGSIYEYTDTNGRRIKCIPTIHPAATFRTPAYARACRADWARIASEAQFRELRLPERTHIIRPTIADVLDFCDNASRARMLSVDIETPIRVRTETSVPRSDKMCECNHGVKRHAESIFACVVKKCPCAGFLGRSGKPRHKRIFSEPYLDCIGFSYDPSFGVCIPLTKDYWGDDDTWMRAWDAVKRLCESPVEKVLQNGLFDAYWLATSGIALRNYRWDTRALHHMLDPLDAHDLAYLTSVYTREPYYKCLSPETRVLFSDLTWRPIKDAKIGDELVGFDETPKTRKRRFRPCKITQKGWLWRQAYQITFDDGTTVTASSEHPWLTQKYDTNHSLFWVETKDLQLGMRIGRLCPPWSTNETFDGGWLSGLVDGEGTLCQGTVTYSQNPGDVLEHSKKLMTAHGFHWREYKKNLTCRRIVLTTVADSMRFLGEYRPVRLLARERKHKVWEGRRIDSFRHKKPKIVGIRALGVCRVVGITTTTKTFIAEGLYTHNSEAKDPESVAKYASRGDAFYTYNSKDACVTLEIAHALIAEVERRGAMEFYNRHYADMLEPLLAVSLHGLRINDALRKRKWDEYHRELRELEASIEAAAGMKLHANTGLSTAKLKHYLYDVLRLPKQMVKNTKGDKVVSTNEVAVRRLMQRFPQKLAGVGDKILQHRRTKQLSTFVKDGLADTDGRVRCLYSPYTDTGRLNSQEPPRGVGRNLQNWDRSLRDVIEPDPDDDPEAA